jgi:hypothetical protein
MDGAITRRRGSRGNRLVEEIDKTRACEFAGSHRKFSMLDPAAADDVTHTQIVRRIEKAHGGARSIHQAREILSSASIWSPISNVLFGAEDSVVRKSD